MRKDCKHFQSRTYPSGDTVRKCTLDLAPEAPWNCPDGCASFAPRLADVNWRHGSAVAPATPDAPESVGTNQGVAELLDEAENIVNAAVIDAQTEIDPEAFGHGKKKRFRWWPF